MHFLREARKKTKCERVCGRQREGERDKCTLENKQYTSCMVLWPEGEERQAHPSITERVKSGQACRYTETVNIYSPVPF